MKIKFHFSVKSFYEGCTDITQEEYDRLDSLPEEELNKELRKFVNMMFPDDVEHNEILTFKEEAKGTL